MVDASVQRLFDLLDVKLDAFAMCEIESSCSLNCDPVDKIVVHFALRGEGWLECDRGTFAIHPGTMIVVPKRMAKRISGSGPISKVVDATVACPFGDGLVKFRACDTTADLVIGCGLLTADVGQGLGLFDHLQQPIVEKATGEILPLLFAAILDELSRPAMGSKTIIEAMMKQILVLLLRSHLKRRGLQAASYMPLLHPKLGRAMTMIVARPQDPHTVESLAAIAGMSRSRFNHHFARTYGRTAMEFVHSVRLRAGARLLRETDQPVKVIAQAVGFASRSHFSRAFRTEFGLDPTAFRAGDGPYIEERADHRQESRDLSAGPRV